MTDIDMDALVEHGAIMLEEALQREMAYGLGPEVSRFVVREIVAEVLPDVAGPLIQYLREQNDGLAEAIKLGGNEQRRLEAENERLRALENDDWVARCADLGRAADRYKDELADAVAEIERLERALHAIATATIPGVSGGPDGGSALVCEFARRALYGDSVAGA